MKKLLFSSVILAILGCGGDQGELPDLFSNYSKDSSSSGVFSSSSSGISSSSSSGVFSSSSSGVTSNSSSGVTSSSSTSSSSSAASSSSNVPVICDEEIYETVDIGTQTWLKRNLNCGKGKSNDPYGKLYDWTTAKKACPQGYHLPTAEDWYKLMKVLYNISEGPPYEDGQTVGNFLANSKWDSGYNGNCGNWWSATDNGDFALNWSLCKGSDAIKWYNNDKKSNFFSVRCLKDE